MPLDLLKTCIIYCRVSSTDQLDGTSLESQERFCREYAERLGLTVLAVFIERGESAKTANRTELNRAIAFCKQRKVGFFIVYKLDRFARNQDDHVMVRAYLRRCGTELRSVTEPIDDTPIGRAMEGVLSVFAEFDNNVRTERSKQGMLERVRQGIWVWPAPLGYLRPHEGANLSPDPKKAPLVRLAFTEYSKGTYTFSRLAAYLAKHGLRTRYNKLPTHSYVYKLITNPVYMGVIVTGGEEYPGSFAPLVSRELFLACQPSRFRPASPLAEPRSLNNPLFPLRGLLQCSECGKRITGSTSRGSKGGRYAYYHHYRIGCSRARSIPKERLEATFTSYLDRFTIDGDVAEAVRGFIREELGRLSGNLSQARSHLRKQVAELEAERQRVFDLHRSGVYSDEEFGEQKRLIEDRIKQKSLSLVDREISFDVEKGLETRFDLLENPARAWRRFNADFDRLLRFQKILVPTGLTFDGEQFGTHSFSHIYQLKQHLQQPSFRLEPLLTQQWNELLDELRGWQQLSLPEQRRGPPDNEM